MKYTILFFVFIAFVSCKQDEKKARLSSSKPVYFDIKQIVEHDIYSNTTQNCSEEKSILVNRKSETHINQKVNWREEMQVLLDCDFNKAGWIGKFDSIVSANGLSVSYVTMSSKIPIKKVTINYTEKKQAINSIIIEKKMATFLISNTQQLFYYPNISFKIIAKQSAIFMQDFNTEIDVKFICK
ncbi:MAG TPA: hypothetical protein PKK18_05175 [Chitinophagales bacterium]|nr:hypothetical protein [Chitinophagales bacterium]HMX59033.1 hypothetical protein [Chitinophagales bacterium]HMZ32964.1 hypothetical protein [Chitinophagales bacterium]HNA38921.1 hypothetical protein [Chitinophagales bacterium]HNC71379.1 hypothetical protein [Chitinophagales bacterium]